MAKTKTKAIEDHLFHMYGKGGLYYHFLKQPPTRKQIREGVKLLLKRPNYTLGYGPRGQVKDILLNNTHTEIKAIEDFLLSLYGKGGPRCHILEQPATRDQIHVAVQLLLVQLLLKQSKSKLTYNPKTRVQVENILLIA